MFAAMAAMLVVSLAIPEAFGDLGLLFGCAYFFVRAMQLLLYVRNTSQADDDDNLGAILKLAPGLLLGSALLIVAGALDGGARTSLWIIALLIDWSTPLLFGTAEFNIKPGPLRRAPRPDRDHRPRRVDRRDRRRCRLPARNRGGGRGGCSAIAPSPRSGGPTSTSSRSSPSGG